jgi:ubiquinone/menaquinone biosynthesis C-methylase UbiE
LFAQQRRDFRDRQAADGAYSCGNPLVRRYFWSRLKTAAREAMCSSAGVILDIGCGRGKLLTVLAGTVMHGDYVGVDQSNCVYSARTEATRNGLHNTQFVRADCLHLPFRSGCSMLVCCVSVLEHLSNISKGIQEVSRILNHRGILVAAFPTENFTYRICRMLARLQRPADHFHQGAYLEQVLEPTFMLKRKRRLPISFLPAYLSLYTILVLTTRRNEQR